MSLSGGSRVHRCRSLPPQVADVQRGRQRLREDRGLRDEQRECRRSSAPPLKTDVRPPQWSRASVKKNKRGLILFFAFHTFSLQSFIKHNKTFHQLFPDIPKNEDLIHGKRRRNGAISDVFVLEPVVTGAPCSSSTASVRLRPAEGSALPRSAVHHRHQRLFPLLGAAQGNQGRPAAAPVPTATEQGRYSMGGKWN